MINIIAVRRIRKESERYAKEREVLQLPSSQFLSKVKSEILIDFLLAVNHGEALRRAAIKAASAASKKIATWNAAKGCPERFPENICNYVADWAIKTIES